MADDLRKVIDDEHAIPAARGNGLLRREIWIDRYGRIARYNLAYIKRAMHAGDNGRVVGYDNQHGLHHPHRLGQVEPVEFVSFEDIEARFERDWIALRDEWRTQR